MIDCRTGRRFAAMLAFAAAFLSLAGAGSAQEFPLRQAIAEAALDDAGLSAFYRQSGYETLWVGEDDRARRAALLMAFEAAGQHGLPAARHDPDELRALMAADRTPAEFGRVEVALSRAFLDFAAAMRTGVLSPSQVVAEIKREPPPRDSLEILAAFAQSRPKDFFADLAPRSQEYLRLFGAKAFLERRIAEGGWGAAVTARRVEPGDSGPHVVALRDRLVAMGYLARSARQVFDAGLRRAVEAFQEDHGLVPDGIVGTNTLAELNRGPTERLGQVIVAMERERWLDRDLGDRHVRVNLTEFRAQIVADGESLFDTRAVMGKAQAGRETPEFSDRMDYVVVNPSWYVPRSIVVGEFLPDLRRNPYAYADFKITDRSGRSANRGRGFAGYTARNFPFSMRQPPGPDNALGRVKFMFPNRYNIYLHDTPAKSLFERPVRAYSHGCVRLAEPFGFAEMLLSFQAEEVRDRFARAAGTRREVQVNLSDPLPVHIVYRTAISKPDGGMTYRRDIYGRDARILAALRAAGVAMPGGAS